MFPLFALEARPHDPTGRTPDRNVQVLNGNRFRIVHLAAGSYTLVTWRRGPNDKGNTKARTERAASPVQVSIQHGERKIGVVLETLPQGIAK